MTKKEAIFELIKYRRRLEEDSPIDAEPFDMAIEALEREGKKCGEWIQHVNEPSLWSCSICETVIYSEHEEDRLKFHKWCGCCGADMKGGSNDGR